MPVYEYRCSKGHDYEMTQGFSAATEQKCIVCGAKAKRQISRPAVIFKGSGFYSTDNRRSTSSSASETSSTSDSAPSASSDNGSSDTGSGHSHGAGGHSHDTPAKPSKKSDKAAD
jgi:putative FmdB family regulatory protein